MKALPTPSIDTTAYLESEFSPPYVILTSSDHVNCKVVVLLVVVVEVDVEVVLVDVVDEVVEEVVVVTVAIICL